jgi:thiol:disulfide interchange protein
VRRFTLTLAAAMISLAILDAARTQAQDILWSTDVRTAWQTAQKANRPLLLFVTSDHCPYCRKMKSETLSDPTVTRHLRDSYVPVVVSADSSRAATQLRINSVPTTVVILPDGRIADRIEGYVSAQKLEARLQSVLEQTPAQ